MPRTAADQNRPTMGQPADAAATATANATAIADAVARVEAVFERRPEAGLSDDAPATAAWQGGTRVVAAHANGARLATDLPTVLAGSGDQATPGWLLRASLASCLCTCIVLHAAARGIRLASLSVEARSRSDARGLLGMHGADGDAVSAGPVDVQLHVRIHAPDATAEALRALVARSDACSPVSTALAAGVRPAVHVAIEGEPVAG